MSVVVFPSPAPLSPPLCLFSLSLLSCISISVSRASVHADCFAGQRQRGHGGPLGTLTGFSMHKCVGAELTQWDVKRELRFITWSESGWLLHRVSPPERGKTSGGGCCVTLTSCRHVEVSLQGLNLWSCVCLCCRCSCWFQCVSINAETDSRQSI